MNAFNERINKEESDINKDLFKEHFNFQRPSDMLKYLHQVNDREKNNKLVIVINSGLEDLNKKKLERRLKKKEKLKRQIR